MPKPPFPFQVNDVISRPGDSGNMLVKRVNHLGQGSLELEPIGEHSLYYSAGTFGTKDWVKSEFMTAALAAQKEQ